MTAHQCFAQATRGLAAVAYVLALCALPCPVPAVAAAGTAAVPTGSPADATASQQPDLEKVRSQVHAVAVVPGTQETEREIAGSYRKDTLGASGGIVKGTTLGSPNVELGGISVGISIPQLMLPGAIAGGIGGQAQRKIQDFRDALARDLGNADNQTLSSSRLALHVYQDLRELPDPGATLYADGVPIPRDVDAVLYVNIRDISIDVRDDEAILKTTAEASLTSKADGTDLYRSWYYYQDQDSLANWTRDDNAVWHDYANFAQHYLSREISADVFSRIDVQARLQPLETDSVRLQRGNIWAGTSKSTRPTFAWELALQKQDDGQAAKVDPSRIPFDLEIYDAHRLVYAGQNIQGTSYTLDSPLDACKSYRWSVRPSYTVDGGVKHGEWMRAPGEDKNDDERANVGKKASEVPAYIQYFPQLKIDCRAK